jgi:hypothetical protein
VVEGMKKLASIPIVVVLLLALFLVSCAPAASKNSNTNKREVPEPSAFAFPIDELIERLVKEEGAYKAFKFTESKNNDEELIDGEPYADTTHEIIYNLPQVSEEILVGFYKSFYKPIAKDAIETSFWFVSLKNPSVKPIDLLKNGDYEKICTPISTAPVFRITNGPLKGAIVYDWSLESRKNSEYLKKSIENREIHISTVIPVFDVRTNCK